MLVTHAVFLGGFFKGESQCCFYFGTRLQLCSSAVTDEPAVPWTGGKDGLSQNSALSLGLSTKHGHTVLEDFFCVFEKKGFHHGPKGFIFF